MLPLEGQIVLLVVYLLAAIVTIVATIMTTISNPTDPTVELERNYRANKENNFQPSGYEFFCAVCNTHVLDASQHCKMCNRCT